MPFKYLLRTIYMLHDALENFFHTDSIIL